MENTDFSASSGYIDTGFYYRPAPTLLGDICQTISDDPIQ
jgi:hypothetical protein